MKRKILPFLTVLASAVMFAQTYSNGPLSTGATSSNGTTAPTGYTWSELQNTTFGNGTLGFGGSGGYLLADDFTVPSGEKWVINSVEVFGYQTSSTGNPFTELHVQFYNGSPATGGTVIFGNLTTNVLTSSTDAMMYRISESTVNTTRKIWDIKGNVSTTLNPGSYWLAYGVTASGSGSGFFPAVTKKSEATPADANAQQYNLTTTSWSTIADTGSSVPVAMPFILNYTVQALGTSEVRQFDSRVVAYPNPTVDSFKLSLPDEAKTKVTSVELFDMSGKLVKSFKAAESYNVSDLGKGVYLVKVKVGNVVKALRIVKN